MGSGTLRALRDRRDRYAAVFASASDALLLLDGAGHGVDVNAAACALFGLGREELVRRARELLAGAPGLQEPATLQGQEPVTHDWELVTGEGGKKVVACTVRPRVLPGLRLVTLRDVTEPRSASAEKARLAALVHSSPDCIIRVGLDRRIEAWNAGAERLCGFTAREVLGQPISVIQPEPLRAEGRRLEERVLQGEVIRDLELVRRHKNGSDVPVSLTLAPVRDEQGRVVAFSGVARDLSALKRAEQRFRELLESAPDAMLLLDAAFRIRLVNRQAEALFGLGRDELMGLPLETLLPGVDAWRSAHPSAPTKASELKGRAKDGAEFDAEVTLSPLRADQDHSLVAAVRDVTEKNRPRDQLILSDRMVSVGTLAAGVAHEINNPLSAVLANLALARGEVQRLLPGAELVAELDDAKEGAERVRTIVRDLKLFSRGQDESPGAVELVPVIESTARMALNQIRHRAKLSIELGALPAVKGNSSRLAQVVLNLLVNAAQAIPEGNAEAHEIKVSARALDDRLVVLTVADTGAGMTPEVLRRLFTPFFSTQPVGQGTGLGLSICRRIVEGLGGRIEVESQEGKGSTFRVFLPAADETAAASPPPERVPQASRKGRVLVVDDEPMICHVARRTLGQEHEVLALTAPREALERVRRGERFDLILCDLMMPQMTGMELHAELARLAPDQAEAMIFTTGGAFTSHARDFLERTDLLCLEKPFDLKNLQALVNERVSRASNRSP